MIKLDIIEVLAKIATMEKMEKKAFMAMIAWRYSTGVKTACH